MMGRGSAFRAFVGLFISAVLFCLAAAQENSVIVPLLTADPENAWDIFRRPGALKGASSGGKALKGFSSLVDGSQSTPVLLTVPTAGTGAWLSLDIETSRVPSMRVQDISLRFNKTASTGANYSACISKGYWIDNAGRRYFTLPNLDGPPDPRIERIGWLLEAPTAGNDKQEAPRNLSLYLPKGCFKAAEVVAVTEVDAYTKTDLSQIGGDADVQIADDHFHPCSFNLTCDEMDFIRSEQDRFGVGSSMVFGLQHQMLQGATPWLKAIGSWFKMQYKSLAAAAGSKNDPLPFHYNDFSARPGTRPGAIPGAAAVNKVLTDNGKATVADYGGWPMTPTLQADWRNLCSYQKHITKVAGRIFPYFSSLRIEAKTDPNRLYDVCSKYNSTGRYMNTMLMRAVDTLFPDSVFGYQEYNLNKTAVAQNIVYPVDLKDGTWFKCMKEVFDYLAATRRPFGFHDDYVPGQLNETLIIQIGKAFPKTIMIWDHGGIAPEVSSLLTAEEHIAALKAFLATGAPGTRYIDMSWDVGFWNRLRPDQIGNVQFAGSGTSPSATTSRDWAKDVRAYLKFMSDNADSVMYGSDQVALNYNSNIQVNVNGAPFVNRNPSTQRTMYSQLIRIEVGTLNNAMKAVNFSLPAAVLRKVFSANARKLQSQVIHPLAGKAPTNRRAGPQNTASRPYTDMTTADARKFVTDLLMLQYKEAVQWVWDKDFVPKFSDFAPQVCKMGW